jgi:formylglycine-generating enzyme required for sulfatase activity
MIGIQNPSCFCRAGFVLLLLPLPQDENKMSHALKTFICYAHEDHEVVEGLKKQLVIFEKKGLLQIWSDGKILPGEHWDKSIKNQLEYAEIILLFISVDFINSDYIEKIELQAALQRHRDGHATLIPIIVRPCHWAEYFDIGQFQALPNKARPILSSHFPHRDEAFFEIAEGLKKTAEDFREKKLAATARAEAEAAAEKEQAEKAARQATAAKLQRNKDDAAWKAAKELDTIEAYESYLEKDYKLHETEAHERISVLEELEAKRRTEQKTKDKAAALAAEARRAKEAEAEQKRLAEEAQKNDPFHHLMIPIKGGSFSMGSNMVDNEKPVHQVTVPDFNLCKYLVTQAQWKQIMGNNPSHNEGDGLPVEMVSWFDVQEFLKKLNKKTGKTYRLPSEAEWEYAARGGQLSKGFEYAGSNDLNEVGWFREYSSDKPLSGEWGNDKIIVNNGKTHPVGQKKPNELGLYDMSGNVYEWCEDDWHDNYKLAPNDGSAWVDTPRDAARVIRGGDSSMYSSGCSNAHRLDSEPDNREYFIGYRLALVPQFSGNL